MLKEEKAAIVNELRQKYPLKDLLQLSGLARSTFYYYIYNIQSKINTRKKNKKYYIYFS